MNTRTSRTAALLSLTLLTTAITPTAVMASDKPMSPRETENSVGQSVQIRTNAEGTPNSGLTDFRWSVTQITATGDPGSEITVRVPEQGLGLRSLERFGFIKQEGDEGQFDIRFNDSGFGTARSVSLVPPGDVELPVKIETAFTLDGQAISAKDLVGKSGMVTARYTVTNLTRAERTVKLKSISGKQIEKTVASDVPMVVQASTLLPIRYGGLNAGTGMGGADGRGNWQMQWIGLPFAPLAKEGSARFGWAANVTDAELPAMLVQVLPLHFPASGDQEASTVAEKAASAALSLGPAPNISEGLTEVKAGLESVLGGIDTLTSGGGEDPLKLVEGQLNNFFQTFGTNIQNVAELLKPENEQGVTAQLIGVQEALKKTNGDLAKLSELLTEGNISNIKLLGDNWPLISNLVATLGDQLPQLIEILDQRNLSALIDCAVTDPAADSNNAAVSLGTVNKAIIQSAGGKYKGHVSSKGNLPSGANEGDGYTFTTTAVNVLQTKGGAVWMIPEGKSAPEWVEMGLSRSACTVGLAAAPSVVDFDAIVTQLTAVNKVVQQLAAIPTLNPDNAAAIQSALKFIAANLRGITTTLIPLTAGLDKVIGALLVTIGELGNQVEIIAAGLQNTNVELPALDSVVSSVVSSILESPGGVQVTGGIGQISGGLGGVLNELTTWIAQLIVSLKTMGAAAKDALDKGLDTAGALVEGVDTLQASVGGLMLAANTSPLPYGGDPQVAPAGTKLAGAYEFRMDPADTEAPSTLPRLLLAIVLLILGGYVGTAIAGRRTAPATSGASPEADATASYPVIKSDGGDGPSTTG
jgi:hypothetical protein